MNWARKVARRQDGPLRDRRSSAPASLSAPGGLSARLNRGRCARMTPAARLSAAIELLDATLAGEPAERALTRWARASRFAGSKDRAAVRDLVYDAIDRKSVV